MVKNKLPLLGALLLGLASCAPTGDTSSASSSSSLDSGDSSSSEVASSSSSSSSASLPGAAELIATLSNPDGVAFAGTVESFLISNGELDVSIGVSSYLTEDIHYTSDEENGPTVLYKGEGGAAIYYGIAPDNTVASETLTNDYGETVYFFTYSNPFGRLIEAEDLTLKEDGSGYEFSIGDSDAISIALTGYIDLDLYKGEIIIDDGSVSSIVLTGNEVDESYYIVVELELSSKEAIKADTSLPTPFPELEGQDALQATFDEIAKGNFTVSYKDEDSTGMWGDVSAKVVSVEGNYYTEMTDDMGNSSAEGYLDQGNGSHIFYVVADGKAKATSTGEEGDIASLGLLPEMSLDAAFFVPEGNGAYTLRDYGIYYASLITPVPELDSFIGYAVPGTFEVVLGDGKLTMSYDYEAESYYYTYAGTVTVEVSKIGTSVAPYGKDDIAPWTPPTNWKDFSIYCYDAMLPFTFGNPDLIPFPLYGQVDGVADGTFSAASGNSNHITLYFKTEEGADLYQILRDYEAMLLNAGWTVSTKHTATLETANGTINMELSINESIREINAVVSSTTDNALSDFIASIESMNATVEVNLEQKTYLGSDNSGELYLDETGAILHEWSDDAYHYRLQSGDFVQDFVLANKTEGSGVLSYTMGSDGAYVRDEDLAGYVTSYCWTLLDAVNYASFFWKDGDHYVSGHDDLTDVILDMLFYDPAKDDAYSADTLVGPLVIDFDEEKLEMTISGTCGAVGYLQDADGNRQTAYQETTFTAAITSIGTTEVEIPNVQ